MPKEKTILQTFKDSTYKDYTFPYLTTVNLSGLISVCRLLDNYYNIPEYKDGEMNTESWFNRNFLLGEELTERRKRANPNAKGKYVPEATMTEMDRVYDEDISDLDKKVSKFYKDITNAYKTLCKEKENDPEFKAFRNMFDSMILPADYQSGDYYSAIADNPYLVPLVSQMAGLPKFEQCSLSELKKGLEAFPSTDSDLKKEPEASASTEKKTRNPSECLMSMSDVTPSLSNANTTNRSLLRRAIHPSRRKNILMT